MSDPFLRATVSVFNRLGHAATYTPVSGAPVTCRAIVNRDVAMVGEYGQVTEKRTQIELMKQDVATPKRGDTIVIAEGVYAGTYTVESKDSDDGYVVRVIVR